MYVNMMMLGREIGLPAELMLGSPGNTGQPEGDQYVGELQTAIEGSHRVARETLKQSQKRMKRDYDVKVRVRELKLGDLVYQLDTVTVPDSRASVPPATQFPYPTSSYWVCTLCFYLQRTLMPLPTAVSIDPSSADFFQ
jgi:hypothetical protein